MPMNMNINFIVLYDRIYDINNELMISSCL